MSPRLTLTALLPLALLGLTGCAPSVSDASAQQAPAASAPATSDDQNPNDGTLDTSMPTASSDDNGNPNDGTLDTSMPTAPPAPKEKPVHLIAGLTGGDRTFMVSVVEQYHYGSKGQKQALAFGREICDSEQNYYDEQSDAIDNADDSFDSDDTNTTIAGLAEASVCDPMTAATKKFIKAMHSSNWVVTATSGRVSVTWSDDGDISQAIGVASPWKKSFDDNDHVTITAQNGGGGTVSCYKVDATGKKFDKSSSTGAYAVVTCG